MAQSTCLIEGCDRPFHCRGWCRRHYQKWRRNGSPTGGRQPKPEIVIDDAGCWLWNGEFDTKGYGMVRRMVAGKRRVWRAHRVIYERHRGPIPPGLEIDHLCRIRACVNPDHLEPVTHAENTKRGLTKIACLRGHFYTPENTYVDPRGRRSCRTCRRMFEGQKRPKRPKAA